MHACPHVANSFPAGLRQVGVNLGQPGKYIEVIAEATRDIAVQVVFCNAGYVLTGFFVDV